MRKTSVVQRDVGRYHLRHNPRPLLPRPVAGRAGGDDLLKRRVKPHFAINAAVEPRAELLQGFFKRRLQLEVRHLEDHARVGTPPQNRLPFAEPRENPARIG